MLCPRCSEKMWKDGFRKGRQAYRCPKNHQAIALDLQGRSGRPTGTGRKDKKLCKIEGCDRVHYAKGLCQACYRRLKKKGIL